ncbi:HD domain-containing protein [Desulfosporosinus sp. SB140]|uniref:HD domain-containing protein n=1 Tax=Desulfosporosinus paludis TaxID=3115649 RepID=UPI00388E9DAE
MNQSQLDYLNSWFKHYSYSFLPRKPKIDFDIQFKIDHTYRVKANTLDIAVSLGLNTDDLRLAEVIGLLHDVGRFEQFAKYGTYRDDISEDHAELGLRVLTSNQVLLGLSEEETNIVETAIRYHNKYLLPQVICNNCLVFCKLIRDADKLDILGQLVHETTEGSPGGDDYSPEVVMSILEGKVVSFGAIKAAGDLKLMRMSWFLDINYSLTIKKLKDQRILDQLVEKLPLTEDIKQVYDFLENHMNQKLITIT